MDDNEYRISWVAPEHEHHDHGSDWYWAVGIILGSLVVAFIIVGNILLSIILLLGIGTLLFHTKHPPKNIECEFSQKGIRMNKTLYPWDTLESFWILERGRDGHENCNPKILLTSKKVFMPHIVVPLNDFILDEVHEVLSHMLEEVPQVEPLHERLTRRLGF
ncbi:MAG: hypothetical protein HZB10_01465 [Candidatus Yonathbacteria bacterium]|nr:hypothetical protein [Candidatus Yonathbacteria bacterium]